MKLKRVVARDANVRPMLLRCWDRLKSPRAALPGCCRLKKCTRVQATMHSSHTSAVHSMKTYSLHPHDQCQEADLCTLNLNEACSQRHCATTVKGCSAVEMPPEYVVNGHQIKVPMSPDITT